MAKRAVIVGIDDYTGIDAAGTSNLSCCVSDAKSISELLSSSMGFAAEDVTLLTDGAATRDAVLSALRTMTGSSQPGDVAAFYFSGHGSVEPDDPANPTCEKFYETMCTATRPFLTDRDLASVAASLDQSQVNFTVISDSCHSGGLDQETDAPSKYKSLALSSALSQQIASYMNTWIPAGIGVPSNSDACKDNVKNVTVSEGGHLVCEEDPSQIFVDQAKMTLISGCRFWELSYETNGHGLLTKAILDTIDASDFYATYGDFVDSVSAKVASAFATLTITPGYPTSQTPQLRGQANRMSEGFLAPWTASK